MELPVLTTNTNVEMEKCDILGNLPAEISEIILLHLKPKDIANTFACCKKWQQLLNYNRVWRKIYKNTYGDSEDEPSSKCYKNMLEVYSVHWHGRYMYRRGLQLNFQNEICNEVTFKSNREKLVHFDDRILIFGTFSYFVIINSITGLVMRKIMFENYHRAIKHGKFLYAITEAGDFNYWSIESGEPIYGAKLDIHNFDCMDKLMACKDLIIIQMNQQLHIFNTVDQNLVCIEEKFYASCTNEVIAMASCAGRIAIVDSNFNSVTDLDCSKALDIIDMKMNDDFLIKNFLDVENSYRLSVWNIKTKANFIISDLVFHRTPFYITKNALLCQTDADTCEMWDMSTQNRLFTIDVDFIVYDIILHDRHIYINILSKSAEWHVWCAQTGKYLRKLKSAKHDFVATTDSKFLCKYYLSERISWVIRDYDANMYATVGLPRYSSDVIQAYILNYKKSKE